jgi:8-oxo-dGTP pyrophosphatase MutT (NUDIX family)
VSPQRVGVIPYLFEEDRLLIVLVRSRDGDRWVLPKGKLEAALGRREAAALEAWEEAGVRGHYAIRERIDVRLCQNGRTLALRLYPLEVLQLCPRWPERGDRRRRVVSTREARKLLGNNGLSSAVRQLEALLK